MGGPGGRQTEIGRRTVRPFFGQGRVRLAADIDLEQRTLHHLAGTGKSGYSGDGGPAKLAQLAGPKGVCLSKTGDLYFADTESHTVRVLRKDSGIIETVVGDGTPGDGPDGAPKQCHLNRPHGVFVSADNWLYIGDSNNHRVRRFKVE